MGLYLDLPVSGLSSSGRSKTQLPGHATSRISTPTGIRSRHLPERQSVPAPRGMNSEPTAFEVVTLVDNMKANFRPEGRGPNLHLAARPIMGARFKPFLRAEAGKPAPSVCAAIKVLILKSW